MAAIAGIPGGSANIKPCHHVYVDGKALNVMVPDKVAIASYRRVYGPAQLAAQRLMPIG